MAENAERLIINRLPSLTWNRLGVNYASVDLSDVTLKNKNVDVTVRNKDQVTVETKPTKDADKWADSFSGGIRREAYVAAKYAIYQEQVFATGLGGNYTDLIEETVPETTIYTVAEGAKLSKPVVINYDFKDGGSAAAQQMIYAGKNSEATFILNYSSDRKAAGTAAFETKVILGEGATVHLMKVNLLGNGFISLDDSAAIVGNNAHFDFVQMILGGKKNYVGCNADECGKKAQFTVNTGYFAEEDHLIDVNYIAAQRGQKTTSNIYAKGSLRGQASKVFRGTIDFRKGTKGSTGDEQEDVLLLDPTVVNKTVPVILTEEEDVDGRHGATIGNLAEDILFYLGTRGIGKEDAEMLMTRGRLLSIAHMIPEKDVVDRISEFIEEAFE